MFAQVVQGRTSDPDTIRRVTEQWIQALSSGAAGRLGSTGGVTDDGRVVVVARFESAEAARRDSDRPERGRWWEETSRWLEDVTFLDSDVVVELTGDPEQAGLVQVMQGQVTDPDRAQGHGRAAAGPEDEVPPRRARPADGRRGRRPLDPGRHLPSEEEARAAERQEPPAQVAEAMQELGSLRGGETQCLDLRRPVLRSPR